MPYKMSGSDYNYRQNNESVQADAFWNFFMAMVADMGEKTAIARQEYIPSLKTLIHLLENSAACNSDQYFPRMSAFDNNPTGNNPTGINPGQKFQKSYLLHGARPEKDLMDTRSSRVFKWPVIARKSSLLPEKYTLSNNWIAPSKMQGFCNTCVAFAITAAIEAQMQISNKKHWTESQYRCSEQFLYFHSIEAHTQPITAVEIEINKKISQGWYITEALKFSEKKGFIKESDLVYNPYNKLTMPPLAMKEHNIIGRIADWGSWPWNESSRNEIKEYFYNDIGGFIISFSFRPDFFIYKNGVYPYIQGHQYSQDSGHAVLCIGYDDKKQAWHCKNSWGTNWGENGLFWLDYNYPVIDELAYGISIKEDYGTQIAGGNTGIPA